MPTYEFRCPQGHEFEKFYRSISGGEAQAACPQCGALAERMMSAAGFAFKGSGFYLTDYGKNAHRGTADGKPTSVEGGAGGAEAGTHEKSNEKSNEKSGERSGEKAGERSNEKSAERSSEKSGVAASSSESARSTAAPAPASGSAESKKPATAPKPAPPAPKKSTE